MFNSPKFILTVLSSILAIAASLAVFWLLYANAGSLDETKAVHLAEAARLEEKRKNIRRTLQTIEANPVGVERLNAFLADRERPIAFIEAVEELADETGNSVSLDLIGPETAKDALSFRLTVDGELPRLIRYLALLENMPYGIGLEEISYQRIASELLRAAGAGNETPPSRLILLLKVKAL